MSEHQTPSLLERPVERLKSAQVGAAALPALAADTILRVIADAAANPAVDVAKMEALLGMQERLMARQAEQEYNEAMARLQLLLPRIVKKGDVKYPVNKSNPDGPQKHAFFFARIEDIDDVIRPLLNAEGFSLSGDTIPQADGRLIVTTTLLHRGGHSKTVRIGPLPLDSSGGKNNVQALGSTFSYGYRYGQRALLNLVYEGEDDDGARGDDELIDAASVKVLSDLLIETRSDLGKFCKAIEVGGLPEIRVADFPTAVNMLMDKRRKMGGAR